MTQHTPAPWKIDAECSAVGNNFCIHDTVDNLHIAETLQIFGQDEANARLIAAAPELLYALENLLAVKNCEGGTMFDSDEIARAAIAKARGEA